MNVLITGCAGFIGYHLCISLLKDKKINVFGIDNLNREYDFKLKKTRLKNLKKIKSFVFYKIDIKNKKKISENFKKNKYKTVVHLAAKAGVRNSIYDPENYFENNLKGFFNIIDASKDFNISNFIYASTSSVYGDSKKKSSNEKDNTDEPKSFYAATKKCNEIIAYSYSNIYNLPTVGLRFFTVYGPYGRPDMAIYKFVKLAYKNKKIDLFNRGNHSRDFTYIDDIVESIKKIILKKPDRKKLYKIFNVSKNESINLRLLIGIIEKLINKKILFNMMPMQKGDVKKTLGDNKLLLKEIKSKPIIKINDGVKKFLVWFKNYEL
jgi:UDP-glucuronate 4-epimerase